MTPFTSAPAAAASELASSALGEWAALVGAAVVGTDRRSPPPPLAGWDTWARSDDPAVAVLDRAVAVVAARRAGARPALAPADAPLAPPDDRASCAPACAVRLSRLLAGEHDLLLAEWFARCEDASMRLPWASLPTLLLRGRRHPHLDQVVRRLAAGRATWLAEVVPEMGVKPTPGVIPDSAEPFDVLPLSPDSSAVVTSIVTLFDAGQATWATSPQLRLAVASIQPVWLDTLVVQLSRLEFNASTERTRSELVALGEFRAEMLREFERATAAIAAARTGDQP